MPPMEDTEDLRRRLQIETRSGSGARQPAASTLVPGLTILFHPDAGRIGERAPLFGLLNGKPQELSRSEPSFSGSGPLGCLWSTSPGPAYEP